MNLLSMSFARILIFLIVVSSCVWAMNKKQQYQAYAKFIAGIYYLRENQQLTQNQKNALYRDLILTTEINPDDAKHFIKNFYNKPQQWQKFLITLNTNISMQKIQKDSIIPNNTK